MEEDLYKKLGKEAFEKLCKNIFPDGPNLGADKRIIGAIWPL